ncbi:hypothetical protein TanjilG_14693 [Lupinus angustifolius]|uniref:Ribosomal protein S3 C-terminal domain-containing protein n=1 Tax=Lupinus angustifolius TaxID=3871 RepID=A0A1J7GSS3_LUPAN|nr:hypothetical protein TanjilG_14693 [Lupinus angustifolius]
MNTQLSKKRKFVADGVFFAELNEVLTRELAEDGYSGEKGRRIRELTSVVQKRFKFEENTVELYAEKVNNRGLCAIAQAESLCYKLLGGLAVLRACYGVLRFVMESGAKGCEGVLGIKVKIMLDYDPKGKQGPKTPLPDIVTIYTPKEEEEYIRPAAVAVLANEVEIPVA